VDGERAPRGAGGPVVATALLRLRARRHNRGYFAGRQLERRAAAAPAEAARLKASPFWQFTLRENVSRGPGRFSDYGAGRELAEIRDDPLFQFTERK